MCQWTTPTYRGRSFLFQPPLLHQRYTLQKSYTMSTGVRFGLFHPYRYFFLVILFLSLVYYIVPKLCYALFYPDDFVIRVAAVSFAVCEGLTPSLREGVAIMWQTVVYRCADLLLVYFLPHWCHDHAVHRIQDMSISEYQVFWPLDLQFRNNGKSDCLETIYPLGSNIFLGRTAYIPACWETYHNRYPK